MKELTIKEQKFVEAFLDTGSQIDSYKEAYACANMKDTTISSNAYKLIRKKNVDNELTMRRAALAERCQVEQIHILTGYFKLIDDYNKGIRFALSDDKEEIKASYRMANFVNGSHVVAALKAIAEMTGLTAPSATNINEGIIINYIQPK